MNKKLIAAAVSAAVVAPVVSYADVTVYGRINNAIDVKDDDANDDGTTVELSTIASRVGVKASAELGNGMTANARYEFATTTDSEGGGIEDTRIATVGMSGGFGSINVGNQWSSFFNYVGTYMDPTYSLGYYMYSSAIAGPYRSSNTIAYSNTFGPVSLQLDIRVQDEEVADANAEKIGANNGVGIGASFNVNENIVLAAAFDSEDGSGGADDQDRAGLAASFGFGDFAIAAAYQSFEQGDDDRTAGYLQGTWTLGKNRFLLGGSSGTVESAGAPDTDPSQVFWGVYHSMGGGLRLYYEGTAFDNDELGDDGSDLTQHLFGMRIDF